MSPPTPPAQPTRATDPQGNLDSENGKQSQGLPCSTQENPSGSLSSFFSGAFLISLMKPSYLWVKKKKEIRSKETEKKNNVRLCNHDDSGFRLGCCVVPWEMGVTVGGWFGRSNLSLSSSYKASQRPLGKKSHPFSASGSGAGLLQSQLHWQSKPKACS